MTAGKTENARKARCAGWRAISYSVDGKSEPEKHGDTAQTVKEVRTHNHVGRAKRCWK